MPPEAPRPPGFHQSITRNSPEHFAAAREALDGMAELLPLFEERHPDDQRPRHAVEALREWIDGERELSMAEVRGLSLASHAAARAASTDAARHAARAACHAIATWHVPTHAGGVPYYGAKAKAAKAKEG